MNIKKIFMAFILTISLLFCFNLNSNATSINTNNLQFKLERVIEIKDTKFIKVSVNNKSNITYSFGWVNSCELFIKTSKGIYTEKISYAKINTGSKNYTYKINAPGDIESMAYLDIRQLDSKGLPAIEGMSYVSPANINVSLDDYSNYNITSTLIVASIVLIAVVLLIIFIIYSLKTKHIERIGYFFTTAGMAAAFYAWYLIIVEFLIRHAAFKIIAIKCICLFGVGMFLVNFGQVLVKKHINMDNKISYGKFTGGMNMRRGQRINNNINEQNRLFQEQMQRQMIEEQNRLFQEQAQRDMEQAQRDTEQAQRDQQQYNDHNNFNNF